MGFLINGWNNCNNNNNNIAFVHQLSLFNRSRRRYYSSSSLVTNSYIKDSNNNNNNNHNHRNCGVRNVVLKMVKDVTIVVAAATSNRGIGYQGQLVRCYLFLW